MADRRVVLRNGLVTEISSANLSIQRRGDIFILQLPNGRSTRSRSLEKLLEQLENRQLADRIRQAFAWERSSVAQVREVFPKHNINAFG